jgi:3-oxoacyl-[acyl-carrier protein] reductase
VAAVSARAVAIVGANGGIGRACADAFAAEGAQLLLFDRAAAPLADFAATLGARASPLDASDEVAVADTFAAARLTAPRLDVLVLAQGIVDTGKLADLTAARFDAVIAANLRSVFLCCHAARDWLTDGGRIVTMSSLAARTGGVITGAAYAASKAGVEALTKSMAQELAPRRITVNCVSPGAIDTPMTAGHPAERRAAYDRSVPLGRHGTAAEVASTVAFLASAGASYLTGTVIAVNGGIRMD